MLPTERRMAIVEEVGATQLVRVESLAARFGVSPETIRRDLAALERDGELRRVYGGAARRTLQASEGSFEQRLGLHAERKTAIGSLAATLIEPAETVFIDMGTTCLALARSIPGSWSGRVLTTSLLVAAELAGRSDVEVFVSGGQVRGGDLSCSGSLAEDLCERFWPARAFVGAGGVHAEAGLTDYHPGEGALRRRWLERTQCAVVLADSSKIGAVAPFHVATPGDIATVVVDDEEHPEELADLQAAGVELMVASLPRRTPGHPCTPPTEETRP